MRSAIIAQFDDCDALPTDPVATLHRICPVAASIATTESLPPTKYAVAPSNAGIPPPVPETCHATFTAGVRSPVRSKRWQPAKSVLAAAPVAVARTILVWKPSKRADIA
jgi:hypothetical protein